MPRTSSPTPPRPAPDSRDELIDRLAREVDRLGPPTRDIRYERRAYEAHVADRLAGAPLPSPTSSTLEQARLRAMADLVDRVDTRAKARRYGPPTALMALLFCILLLVIAFAIGTTE